MFIILLGFAFTVTHWGLVGFVGDGRRCCCLGFSFFCQRKSIGVKRPSCDDSTNMCDKTHLQSVGSLLRSAIRYS